MCANIGFGIYETKAFGIPHEFILDTSDPPSQSGFRWNILSYPTVTRSYQVDTCNKLQVDTDIVRGLPLARTLQRSGWLWKTSPIDMEAR